MNQGAQALRWRNLRTVLGLAALFLLPLVASFFLYYIAGWHPAASTNHGELIQPPIPLPALHAVPAETRAATETPAVTDSPSAHPVFRRQWTLVYAGRGDCARQCRDALYLMRQTRAELNNDMLRVARVFLVTDTCCAREFLAREHPGLIVLDAQTGETAAVLQRFPSARADTVFIVDPLGNLMMRYDVRRNPRGLFEDLKKLLRLSQIG